MVYHEGFLKTVVTLWPSQALMIYWNSSIVVIPQLCQDFIVLSSKEKSVLSTHGTAMDHNSNLPYDVCIVRCLSMSSSNAMWNLSGWRRNRTWTLELNARTVPGSCKLHLVIRDTSLNGCILPRQSRTATKLRESRANTEIIRPNWMASSVLH